MPLVCIIKVVAGAVEGDGPGGSHCPPGAPLVVGGSRVGELDVGAELWLNRCAVLTGGVGALTVLPGTWAAL